jgi:hypothetical protein
MNKYTRILVAVTLLFGLRVAANAEPRAEIVVTLPFEFVVSGQALPPGTYKVNRVSDQPFGLLALTRKDNGTSIFVSPNEMENASDYKPTVSFHTVGEQHILDKIQTADYVYKFPASRSVNLAAAAKPRDITPVSGSAGSK